MLESRKSFRQGDVLYFSSVLVQFNRYEMKQRRHVRVADIDHRPCCTAAVLYVGSVPGGAEPQVGWRAGKAEVEVGQGDVADQGDVPGRAGRGSQAHRRGDQGEGATRGPRRVARGTARGEHSEVDRLYRNDCQHALWNAKNFESIAVNLSKLWPEVECLILWNTIELATSCSYWRVLSAVHTYAALRVTALRW